VFQIPRLGFLSFGSEGAFGCGLPFHHDGEGPCSSFPEPRAKPDGSGCCPSGPRAAGGARQGPHPTLGTFLPGKRLARKQPRSPGR